MKFKDLFGRKDAESGVEHLNTRGTDSFANGALFEIKAVVSSAIAQALQDKEGRYMRSILQESHFLLQGVSIRALDGETARQMEDFIAAHESIQPDFRQHFFRQVLQPEYRSSGGARVKVPADLVPVIELDQQTLEPQTEDESFILSLKGRRVRFEARAVLEGPVRSVAPSAAPAPAATPTAAAASTFGRAASNSAGVGSAARAPTASSPAGQRTAHAMMVEITVHDRAGRRTRLLPLPVLVGRDVSQAAGDAGMAGLEVDATFVSRRQLLLFELMGQVYGFVPRSASLTLSTPEQQVWRADVLQAIHPGQSLRLTGGVPMDTLTPPAGRESTSDYPVIELQLGQTAPAHEQATPRPRAV